MIKTLSNTSLGYDKNRKTHLFWVFVKDADSVVVFSYVENRKFAIYTDFIYICIQNTRNKNSLLSKIV